MATSGGRREGVSGIVGTTSREHLLISFLFIRPLLRPWRIEISILYFLAELIGCDSKSPRNGGWRERSTRAWGHQWLAAYINPLPTEHPSPDTINSSQLHAHSLNLSYLDTKMTILKSTLAKLTSKKGDKNAKATAAESDAASTAGSLDTLAPEHARSGKLKSVANGGSAEDALGHLYSSPVLVGSNTTPALSHF
ncbi:hypothetical protein GQ54DRAFT_75278 [Martensiomyces pterosporus]|nr:hypothetical protein GQ54DRAFT_75278 [Martensiomyces pterosporus]